MNIDEKNTLELKVSLLSKGVNFSLDLFKQITRPFYDNQFVYGKTSDHVTPQHKFPQVLELGDETITAILRRENSPWNLRIEDDQVQLYHNNEHVREVGLPERPPYFDKKLTTGIKSESIIAVAGAQTPGFFLYPDCYYFSEGVPCGFCSMKPTRASVGKSMVADFTKEDITEATRLFQNTPWRNIPIITITMGTCRTDEELRKYVIEPIKWMYDALDPKIPIHLLAHPPNNLDVIEEFKDAGVKIIAFNLELYDRKRFENHCPGKSKHYGYDKWIEALTKARDVFGDYNVFCGLLWGLEPSESTIEGHRYFLDKGIGIASNIFHADPRSILRNHLQPSEETIFKIANAESKLFKEFPKSKTIFDVSMRSTIDYEVRRGDLG